MSLTIEVHDGLGTVSLRGKLDATTVPDLEGAFASLTDFGLTEIAVDLAALTFMDSIGVPRIVRVTREHPDVSLTVLNPTRQVRGLFDMLGVGFLLHVS